MASVSSSDWFKVQGWMVTDLHLQGYELVTYALVHTFTRSKVGIYAGGVPYLSKFLGIAPNTVRKNLRSLVAKGLIEAIEGDHNGVPFVHYRTLQKLKGDTLQGLQGDPSKFAGGTLQGLKGINKEQKGEQKWEHNLPKEEKKSTKKESFTDSIVRQWQNKQ